MSDPSDPAEREAGMVAERLVRGIPLPPIGHRGRAGPAAPSVLLSPASDTISRHTSWYGDLDERALGQELLARARSGDFAFVQETLDALGSTDRDDVAYEFCVAAGDPDIVAMTTSAAGRAVIDRLFDELTEGSKDADEQQQADRLLSVKAARIRPEDFLSGVRSAKVFPFRMPGFTVLDDAPISAQRRPGGRIRVHMPSRVLGTAMFRAETRTLPASTFLEGLELPENEIVGVRLYDLGGVPVYRPALILVELSNETTTNALTKIAEAVGIGLTLGAGSLVGLGVEATMAARVLLWADRAAFVLGTLSSVIKEHRGEILARFGDAGREFLQYVDYVHSATAIYGFARVALSLGQLVNGLRTAYANLRNAARRDGAASELAGDLTVNTEELLRKAEDIQGANAKASAAPRGSRPGDTEPPTTALPAVVEASPLAKVRSAEEFYPGHQGAVGTLEAPGRQPMRIKSGVDGGPWGGTQRGGIPRGRGEAFTSGGPSQGNIATHVEGHAAAIMHQQGLTEATLTMGIDQCTICGNNLPSALPPGAVLRVDHVAPSGQVSTTIYRSSHGR
ncbi:DddA-like double-stranded DNA deaminase toxin [Streptomyces sp. NPDC056512]|uniref:DddA-like double-stranded DNA deaminase toxin n=1 Tax=Streptomyces sp. NPDC056512 TaxID=3345846 RepID=UPI00369DBA21